MKKILLTTLAFFLLYHAFSQQGGYRTEAVTVAGGNFIGDEANKVNSPEGIFVDAVRNVYVTDKTKSRVQKWAPGALEGVSVAGMFLNRPTDVQVDAAGNIYVADYNSNRVLKFPPGNINGIVVAGGNGEGTGANQLHGPDGIFVDASGNVYVADSYNARIQKWAPGASMGLTVAGSLAGTGSNANQLAYPADVFVDKNSNVYVADQFNGRIQKWTPGAVTGITVAGGKGYGSAADQLVTVKGIWVDDAGNMFIVDNGNNRVQEWFAGATSGITVAGGKGNGSSQSQLFSPTKIWLDAGKNIYVGDEVNFRVQRFDVFRSCPSDIIITVPSCSDKASLTWTVPRDTFPDTLNIPRYLDPAQGNMVFMGSLNSHGYYRSLNTYSWPDARYIAEFVGDTSVDGHLVTITNQTESNFLTNLTNGTGLTPWIGLYSTGKPLAFRWVTGEPYGFNRWATGEPNNYLGNGANLQEPYVNMYDMGAWNDQRSASLKFMAEFEQPVTRYRQISGPANGSQQSVGSYMICYERTNFATNTKDTCCFSITVRCATGTNATTALSRKNVLTSWSDSNQPELKIFPNPSNTSFNVQVSSLNQEKITIQIHDITGKLIETKTGLSNHTLLAGGNLKPGTYFIKIIQGSKIREIKVMKQ